MKRDIQKRVQEGERFIMSHSRVDMSVSEITAFWNKFMNTAEEGGTNEAIIEMIHECFLFGVAVGQRAKV